MEFLVQCRMAEFGSIAVPVAARYGFRQMQRRHAFSSACAALDAGPIRAGQGPAEAEAADRMMGCSVRE